MDGGEEVNLHTIIVWSFMSLVSGVIAFSAYSIRADFKEMSLSLQGLSVSVATLNERLSGFTKRVERLEKKDNN